MSDIICMFIASLLHWNVNLFFQLFNIILEYSCLGEGIGNPLKYSCLKNPMERGAWKATVHGVAKNGHD